MLASEESKRDLNTNIAWITLPQNKLQGSIPNVSPIYSPALVPHNLSYSDPFRRMLLNDFSVWLFALSRLYHLPSTNRQVCPLPQRFCAAIVLTWLQGKNQPCGIRVSAFWKSLIASPVLGAISIGRRREICRHYKFPVTNYVYIDFVILPNLHLLCCLTELLCFSEDRITLYFI